MCVCVLWTGRHRGMLKIRLENQYLIYSRVVVRLCVFCSLFALRCTIQRDGKARRKSEEMLCGGK